MITISDTLLAISESSAEEVIQAALKKIEDSADYNAVISTIEGNALQRAKAVDAGEITGPLAGVPFIAKDMFNADDSQTTAASNILKEYESAYQATVITLLEDAGAILIGKANQDAFGHGGSTENSDFGPSKNPVNPEKVPGGSSGGSATVVGLDIVPFSLGTDTGGSTRQPGSFSGLVGFKPTYGAISRYGVIAMASSTDTVGILAHNSNDVATVTEILAKVDEMDAVTLDIPRAVESKKPIKVGVVKEYMTDDVAPAIRSAINNRLSDLEKAGEIELSEVSLPSLPFSIGVYYIIVPAEISSNLARYDGIRYGAQQTGQNLEDLYELTRAKGLNAENKRRILIGAFVLSSGYYDAYYEKALKVRSKIITEFNEKLAEFDVLVGPTTPTTAFGFGENSEDPVKMYLSDVMTVAPSLAGLPAISVPVGADDNGLPIGMQIISKLTDDFSLLKYASTMEITL